MRKRLKYCFLFLTVVLLSSCSEFQRLQKSQDIEEKYQAAIKFYENEDYYKAGMLLEELIPILRGKEEAEKALFYYAYCHYYQSQLVLSAYYFDNLVATYPRSEYAEESGYMHIKSLFESTPKYNLDQSETFNTIDKIQAYVNRYSETQYLDACNRMVDDLNKSLELKAYENAKLYHRLKYYKSAIIALETFANDYSSSKFVEEIKFLRIESQFNLAKVSVEQKQKERYYEVVDFYQEFVDTYPESKYLKIAEDYYSQALNYIEKVKTKS